MKKPSNAHELQPDDHLSRSSVFHSTYFCKITCNEMKEELIVAFFFTIQL